MNNNKNYTRNKRAGGFSLLELLIAVLIFATGLIGTAALQAAGLRNNHETYLRTQAVQLAYDMADRMRANRAGVETGKYDALSGSSLAQTCITTAGGCTPSEVAKNDDAEWGDAIETTLPAGAGSVVRDGEQFVITVSWDQRGSADTDADTGVDSTRYRLRVKL